MKIGLSQLLNAILLCGIITLLTLHQLPSSTSTSSTSVQNQEEINAINYNNNINNNNNNLRKEEMVFPPVIPTTTAPPPPPPPIEEKIIAKEIVIKEVSKENNEQKLHPNWQESILRASNSISFKKLIFSVPRIAEVSFWYPVEETLHSANYILDQEVGEVSWWVQTIELTKRTQSSCNVLDVGSNGGFFSLLSRKLNCNVLAVDAQPWCLTRLSSGAAINGFTDKISTRWTAVSDSPNLTISVGATKCSGLWAVKNSEWINKESSATVQVQSTSCSTVVNDWLPNSNEKINLMKIDAEGSEIGIIRSALPLLKLHRIEHILAEFVPGRTKEITPFDVVQDTLTQLYDAGYQCFNVVTGGVAVELSIIHEYFNPTNLAKGRNTPKMWRCSLISKEKEQNENIDLYSKNAFGYPVPRRSPVISK